MEFVLLMLCKFVPMVLFALFALVFGFKFLLFVTKFALFVRCLLFLKFVLSAL